MPHLKEQQYDIIYNIILLLPLSSSILRKIQIYEISLCHLHVCFDQLAAQSVKKLSDKSFLADHPELQDGDLPLCTDKVVLLIDEYDTPLTHYLETNRDPHELQEFYCHLFATIKKI